MAVNVTRANLAAQAMARCGSSNTILLLLAVAAATALWAAVGATRPAGMVSQPPHATHH
jgi:hypothetical protein